MSRLKENVTVTRDVDWRIADLVYFVRECVLAKLTDEEVASDEFMVKRARAYWDRQHGED